MQRSSLIVVFLLSLVAVAFAVAGVAMLNGDDDAPSGSDAVAGAAAAPQRSTASAAGGDAATLEGRSDRSTVTLTYPKAIRRFSDVSVSLAGTTIAEPGTDPAGGWIVSAYLAPGNACPKNAMEANNAGSDVAEPLITGNVFAAGPYQLANFTTTSVPEGPAKICLYLDQGMDRTAGKTAAEAAVTVLSRGDLAVTMDTKLDFPAGEYVADGDDVEGGSRVAITVAHEKSKYDGEPVYRASRVRASRLKLTSCRRLGADATEGPTTDLDLSKFSDGLEPEFVGQTMSVNYEDEGGHASLVGGFTGDGRLHGTLTFDINDPEAGICTGALAFVATRAG